MRQTIHGIYLGHINYSDTSVIARFYTKEYGKRNFLIKGVRSKKSRSVGLLQPLNEIQITSNFQPSKELNTSYGIENNRVLHLAHIDFRKSSIALFLAEVLNKSIIEEEPNTPLYQFLIHRFQELNTGDFDTTFHHKFMIELSLFLGFYPRLSNHQSDHVFNLEEGIFEHENNNAPITLNIKTSKILKELLETGELSRLNSIERNDLLDGLTSYFEVQLGLKTNSIQSHQILKEVFS